MGSISGADRRFGETLIENGDLGQGQFDAALAEKERRDRSWSLPEVVADLGMLPEERVVEVLGDLYRLPVLSFEDVTPSEEALNILPSETLRKYRIFPVFVVDEELTVAVSDPSDAILIDMLARETGKTVRPAIIGRSALLGLMEKYYPDISSQARSDAWKISRRADDTEDVDVEQLKEAGEELSVIDVVDRILLRAVEEGASDIHIEPTDEGVRVRYRVDGILYDEVHLPPSHKAGVVSRIKILAGLDIAERKVPQDGRIEAVIREREIEMRVSTLPVFFGEKVVIRLLDKSRSLRSIDNIGLMADQLAMFERLITEPHGIVLVTGPTGSGKTTTLYSALSSIDAVSMNVVTIEDPVEYQLPKINQVPVNVKQGRTFAAALRSILRQDPDVILVGEIRDPETGKIAAEAALTGHLIFSTLHTNDAISAVTRLVEIGVEPYLIAPSLRGVIAQRLVRRICPECREAYTPTSTDLKMLNLEPGGDIQFFRGRGCRECGNRGYHGRLALYEILMVDDAVREMIADKAGTPVLRRYAAGLGFRDMRYDGMRKMAAGLTTAEEVLRATRFAE